jgi:hypothetical protein
MGATNRALTFRARGGQCDAFLRPISPIRFSNLTGLVGLPPGSWAKTFSLSRCRCDSWRCDSYGSGQVVPRHATHDGDGSSSTLIDAIRRLLARAAEALAEVLHRHRVRHERAGLDAAARGEIEVEAEGVVACADGQFRLSVHSIICGDSTDPVVVAKLMDGDPPARLVLTDEPYNVPIVGNVTGGAHREFLMASGEMNDAEFLAFNSDWMNAALPWLCDGGVLGTFINWRGYPTVFAAASKLALNHLNLIVCIL